MSDPLTPSADDLRRALLEAAAQDDPVVLEQLCARHRDAILRHFADWKRAPESVRNFPPLLEGYIQGLVAIARCFEQRLGRPELLQALQGPPGANPLVCWQETLEQARMEMEALKYTEAAARLERCLEEVRGLKGSGVAAYLPVTYGYLGECHFQSGNADTALAPTTKALELCRAARDSEGERTYLGNLYEIHRYRGDAPAAAERADDLADLLQCQGDTAEARRYRQQAALVRHGEPANRVICDVNGRRLEVAEAVQLKMEQVQFAYERNRLTLHPATVLTQRGQELGSRGENEAALELFQKAAAADRFEPHSRYQAGLALLCLERYSEAVEIYEEVEALAPGWFHCRSDLWLARQLAAGRFNHPLFLLYHHLVDGSAPPAEKVRLADQALKQVPNVAFLHRVRGHNLLALQQREAAAAAFREGLRCAEEDDIRTRLLVDVAATSSDVHERRRLLDEATRLQGNLVAAATAALLLARS
jgi:tetratricopeptide (TPR) repeat protein